MTPVILARGAGERLWPLSKLDYPKQFALTHGTPARSLFQQTLLRVADRAHFAAPLISCNDTHRFIVAEQLRAIGIHDATLITEPEARNTAPALAIAALSQPEDTLLLVLPSDHRIEDNAAFLDATLRGAAMAREGWLVTFAASATTPETGFGYIRFGEAVPGHASAHRIAQFIEKPDRDRASALLREGNAGWNCGIFLTRAALALSELNAHAPDVLSACAGAYENAERRAHVLLPDAAAWHACPSISIDYAFMEHTTQGAVLPVRMGWSDLGSFAAVASELTADHAGNTLRGNVLAEDTSCVHLSSDGPLVAALGVSDLVVVAADRSVLVTHKNRTQDIKPLLQQLRARAAPELHLTSMAHKPWGSFYRIDQGPHYQVKRLHLKPGGKISLQTHAHRSEHWVVIEGRATVTNGERVEVLEPNQSTYIAANTIHRLENREDYELVVIEVQTGSYLGEDDIVRHEDSYHRQ